MRTGGNKLRNFFLLLAINIVIIAIGDRIVGWLLHSPVPGPIVNKKQYIRLKQHPPNVDHLKLPDEDYMAGTDGLIRKNYRFRTDEFGFPYSLLNSLLVESDI